VITVNGKNILVKDFIEIPEVKNTVINVEEKKKFIDLEDENKKVEVSNEEEQENKNDALNSEYSGSDYLSEDDMEGIIAE
jgi:hypothetical protein